MDALDHWIADIDEALDALGREVSLDILVRPGVALARTVAREGFPGVLPLWSGELQTVGLLADPAVPPTAWPAVVLARRQGLTLSTDSRTLLPQLILHRVLSNLPKTTDRLAIRWKEIETRVFALHRTLGGRDESLRAVIAAVEEPATRRLFTVRPGHEPEFELAHSRLARQIDQSEPFRNYANWLDGCVENRCTPVEAPVRYGSWSRRVLCWAQRLRHRQPGGLVLPVALVRRIVEERAGIDSGVPTRPSWGARAGAASGETALVEAATSIVNEPSSGDPVSDGLAKALAVEGVSYRGYTHAEAVVALDESGEPERAWQVLQSAAWWAARNAGHVPDAMLTGALYLAERHDWEDILRVVRPAIVEK